MTAVFRPTIGELLLERIKQTPDQTAYVFLPSNSAEGSPKESKALSFKDVYDTSKIFSDALFSLGVKPGHRVGLVTAGSQRWVFSYFGALGAGASTVSLDARLSPQQLVQAIQEFEIHTLLTESPRQLNELAANLRHPPETLKAIVTTQNSTEALPNIPGIEVLNCRDFLDRGERANELAPGRFDSTLSSERAIEKVSTFKSTDFSHSHLVMGLYNFYFGAFENSNETDVVLSTLPFSSPAGQIHALIPFSYGVPLALSEEAYPSRFVFETFKPKTLITTESVLKKFFQNDSSEPFHIFRSTALKKKFGGALHKTVLLGDLSDEMIEAYLRAAKIETYKSYFIDGGLGPITLTKVNSDPASNETHSNLGKPHGDIEVRVATDGEIWVKTGQNPKSTSSDLGFATGDLGLLNDSGELIYCGKKDSQFMEAFSKKFPLIDHLVSFQEEGERGFLALITLNRENLIGFAQDRQLLYSNYEALIRNPVVFAEVRKIVDEINTLLEGRSKISRFLLLPHEFSIESGELSPLQTLNRDLIQEKYRDQLELVKNAP